MARIGIIGVGKMGLSHLAIFGAHPDVEIVGIVEPQSFVASAVKSQTGIETYKNHERLIDETRPDASSWPPRRSPTWRWPRTPSSTTCRCSSRSRSR
ncbi:MAG: Gfo/Idh/MocA family oxidoreductase [Ilumatobacteraceae bacterium]